MRCVKAPSFYFTAFAFELVDEIEVKELSHYRAPTKQSYPAGVCVGGCISQQPFKFQNQNFLSITQ